MISSCDVSEEYVKEANAISNQQWICKHSVIKSKVPITQNIKFELNFEEIAKKRKSLIETIDNDLLDIQVKTDELEKIKKLALQDSNYDYGDCALDLVNRTQEDLEKLCHKYSTDYKKEHFSSDSSMKRWCKNVTIAFLAPAYEVASSFYAPEKMNAKKIYEESSLFQKSEKTKMIQEIQKNCSIPLGEEELYTDPRFLKDIKSITSSLNEDCKKRIIKNFTQVFINSSPPPLTVDPLNGQKSSYTQKQSERRKKILQASALILENIPLGVQSEQEKRQEDIFQCQQTPEKSEIEFLANLLKSIEKDQICNSPREGEEILLDEDIAGASSHYIIKKIDQKKFQAVVNLKLENPTHREKANNCLKTKIDISRGLKEKV